MAVILIVEDEREIREELRDALVHAGYSADAASNGLEASGLLHRLGYRPDLILLDLMMPGMDGWAFRAEQLKDRELAAIPVVLLSGAADVRRACAELGAAGFLVKPFHVEALLAAVRRALPAASLAGG